MTATKRVHVDTQHHGDEPVITEHAQTIDFVHAYNWFNYYYDSEDAKGFILSYLKSQKKKDLAKSVASIPAIKLRTIGWNCRMLNKGSVLPSETEQKMWEQLDKLVEQHKPVEQETPTETTNVVSIKDRVAAKISEVIAYLEEQIDTFIKNGENEFDATQWITSQSLKPQIAKKIVDYYTPLYVELTEALKGTDKELRSSYSHLNKTQLKRYVEFIKSIVGAADTQVVVSKTATKKTRKPRKKKNKPATVLVSKIKCKDKDDEFGIVSIKPTDIIGAQQLWIFNTKYRSLTVLNAMGPAGLTVKGTTVLGFDETTSISKKLRKPKDILNDVISCGKVTLRNLMKMIKTKEAPGKGRINTDVIILRAVK